MTGIDIIVRTIKDSILSTEMHSIREVFRKVICVKNTTIIKNINIKDKVSKRDFEIVNYFYGNRVK